MLKYNLFFHNIIIDKIINCIYLDLSFKLTWNKYLSTACLMFEKYYY